MSAQKDLWWFVFITGDGNKDRLEKVHVGLRRGTINNKKMWHRVMRLSPCGDVTAVGLFKLCN